jgi:ribosomal protein S18 acetylase RimI-like enzyme
VSEIEIRDMTPDDEYYVGTCTHENESAEIDASCGRRLTWLKGNYENGIRTKAALLDSERVGFIYIMPIEVCPWGPLGQNLMVVPCLVAHSKAKNRGVGRALLAAAEEETRAQGRKGLVIEAYDWDFFFMPLAYFEKLQFEEVERVDNSVLLWKRFDETAEPPRHLKPDYKSEPVPGRVVVDLFYNTFCETSDIEAERVREVAAEFGDGVILNEYPADDRETLLKYQIPRGIYVNGESIFWGHEAPKEGVREAINKALGE